MPKWHRVIDKYLFAKKQNNCRMLSQLYTVWNWWVTKMKVKIKHEFTFFFFACFLYVLFVFFFFFLAVLVIVYLCVAKTSKKEKNFAPILHIQQLFGKSEERDVHRYWRKSWCLLLSGAGDANISVNWHKQGLSPAPFNIYNSNIKESWLIYF